MLSSFWNILAKSKHFILKNLKKAQLIVQISPQQIDAKLKSNYNLIEQRKLYPNKFWFIKIDYEINWKSFFKFIIFNKNIMKNQEKNLISKKEND